MAPRTNSKVNNKAPANYNNGGINGHNNKINIPSGIQAKAKAMFANQGVVSDEHIVSSSSVTSIENSNAADDNILLKSEI